MPIIPLIMKGYREIWVVDVFKFGGGWSTEVESPQHLEAYVEFVDLLNSTGHPTRTSLTIVGADVENI